MADDAAPRNTNWTAVGVVVGLGLIVLVAVNCSGDDNSRGPSSGDALVSCHHAVEAQLNNPATADFKTLQTTITDTRITGVVEADNDFGVTQEISYTCSISGGAVTGARVSQ